MKLEGEHGVIQHFLMDCRVRSRSKHTLLSYEHCLFVLARLLRELCSIDELERVEIINLRQCVGHLLTAPVANVSGRRSTDSGKALSVNSVRGYVRVWKVFFNWCFQEGLVESNAATRLAVPKPEKKVKPAFTSEHVEKMLAVCDASTPMGFRNYAILLLLFDTGIRLAEICSLTVADVHDSYIKVLGKGRKEREVGIHPEVSKLLWKYIHKYRRPHSPDEQRVFIGQKGPLTNSGLQQLLERIQHAAGLDDIQVSPHVFRHTFAKLYLMRGGDVFKLSREMGHSDVAITKVYLEDFGSEQARTEHNSYSPVGTIDLKKHRKRKKK